MSQANVWFITGASRGIGAAIARAALSAGHRVVATGRQPAHIAQALQAPKEQLLVLPLDVSEPAQADTAVAQALAQFGQIDVLVNNAGYGQLGLFEVNSATDIEQQFATNVFGSMHVTRAVLPAMRARRQGHVFNLSSMAGVLGFPAASIYCASKFAIEGFSEALAMELVDFGVRVTLVEPGFIRTDVLDGSSARYGALPPGDYAALAAQLRATYDSYNHQQAGDPDRLATALLELAGNARAPLRFAAGSDAYAGITAKLQERQAELAQWQALSASVDARQR